MMKDLITSQFISGELEDDQDIEMSQFIRRYHKKHCRTIFKDGFEYVHLKMDKKSQEAPGRDHRIDGHNLDFIMENFIEKEVSAAYFHLLGDFIDDILPFVFNNVVKDIQRKDISPPCFFSFGENDASWDVKEQAMEDMAKGLGKVIFNILEDAKNRREKVNG